jgi:GH24 family phage-related lysozyme (muramidase)
MILSERGAEFIEREEGYRADAYNDSQGYCTVGIGHLIGYHACTSADHATWDGMSMATALKLLAADNAPGLQAIQHWIKPELTQPQVDALCSLLYNCGPGAITGGVQRAINNGQPVDQAFLAWAHPSVLLGRRQREVALFNHGDYADGKPPWKPAPHVDPDVPPAKLPRWFWKWAEWRLGRGQFKNHGHDPALRHLTKAPDKVPPWALKLLDRYVKGEPIR